MKSRFLLFLSLTNVSSFTTLLRPSSRYLFDSPLQASKRTSKMRSQQEESNDMGMIRRDFLSMAATLATWASTGGPAHAAPKILSETSFVSMGSSPKIQSYDPDIPFSSIRRYKTIQLVNGMNVLLVSDKRAYRASAALSVRGAGQFADPLDLPGCAHLLEHMILSYNSKSIFRKPRDFEDWLGDNDGASNAFTAYQTVCFHFSCPESVFGEALQRFAGLFIPQDVAKVCSDADTLKREVRRVNSELDFDDVTSQANYLVKSFVNLEHPYARFSAGSLETLETRPLQANMDVRSRLIDFFQQYYLPSEAVLVVIGPQDFYALDRMVVPFSTTLSRVKPRNVLQAGIPHYPGGFLQGNRYKHVVLLRQNKSNARTADTENMSLQWSLDLDYRLTPLVTATQIAFCLAQILGRRGPGSLYMYLLRRKWIPSGPNGVPRVSVPVEVSGFQIIKLDITVTLEGFINRSSVVSAVYDSLETLQRGNAFVVPRELVSQYATIAKLQGFILAPRPPDSIELAMDAQLYGLGRVNRVGTGKWYRFPDDRNENAALQRAVEATLSMMSDPNNGVIIVTAGSRAVAKSGGDEDDSIPPLSSSKWFTEPITGGRFYFQDMLKTTSKVEDLILNRIISRNELLPPVINPLVPSFIRQPRIVREVSGIASNANEIILFPTASEELNDNRVLRMSSSYRGGDSRWNILDPAPGQQYGLPLPRGPPESTCRCVFVLELLSPRPARANVRQAGRAELWKISFETMSMADLAELGAPGALAYDLSFNKFGLRLCVLGISQTLPSYTRRLARRLVEHSFDLFQGPEYFSSSITDTAVRNGERAPNLSLQRKRLIVSNLRRSTAYDAASEGIAFLRSCTGTVCFAQGDLMSSEINNLVEDLKQILEPSLGAAMTPESATPDIDDLLYKPNWKPRSASLCSVTGMSLISDACGRIPR